MILNWPKKVKNIELFLLGHTDELMRGIPKHDFITGVDLRTLVLEEVPRDNQLAESRFFHTKRASSSEATWVGMGSARWEMLYEPPFGNLGRIPEILSINQPFDFLAPLGIPIVSNQLDSVIKDLTAAHPGMSSLFRWVVKELGLSIALQPPESIPLRNTFVTSGDVFKDLVLFQRTVFRLVFSKYQNDLPYSYLCWACGRTSPDGIGRYGRDRHASFFYERVTSLFFLTQKNFSGRIPPKPPSKFFRSAVNELWRRMTPLKQVDDAKDLEGPCSNCSS